MADGLKLMGDILPVEQWMVTINQDGNAEVCVSHVDGFRYWYLVESVRRLDAKAEGAGQSL